MCSGCNTRNPGAAGSRASAGEGVFADVMIEGVSDIAGVSEPSEEALNFLLVAGPGGHHHHSADNGLLPLPSGVFLFALRRQRAFEGLETVNRNQVPDMKFVRRLLSGAPGERHGRRPQSDIVAPFWGAASSRFKPHCAIPPCAAGDDAQRLAVDICRVAGKMPSPQTAKSANVSAGRRSMGLMSIQVTTVRDDGNAAPARTGCVDDGKAAPVCVAPVEVYLRLSGIGA
jgi:hypothetical protein